ncbi:hypothetical protein RND71_028423 [Anisodus tanguticus]|uniref:Uncharacterized protein n=1 Tax=Anisodus tanguticus TaxID=243964 RepID=A0AAE1RJS3_9SOLA|nr:hypothetical protein RND71_028423 [Anisodus tanguticus]
MLLELVQPHGTLASESSNCSEMKHVQLLASLTSSLYALVRKEVLHGNFRNLKLKLRSSLGVHFWVWVELTGNTLLDKNQTREGCISGVKEDYIAYLEPEAKGTSFVGLLTIGGNSAMRNTFTQIQEPVIRDFGNAESEINMPKILNTLAEYMGVTVCEKFPEFERRLDLAPCLEASHLCNIYSCL